MVPQPVDERPHPLVAGTSECWTFDFVAADASIGGWVRLVRHPERCWYQAMLTGPHRQLLAVVDLDVPHRSNPMELRTTGLWADHICEQAFDHWTIGLEAFSLGVDDPLELYGRELGDRVPLGFDLEWETDGPVLATDQTEVGARPGVRSYGMPCRVYGEVLVGAEVVDLAAVGYRTHEWGPLDWRGDGGWSFTGALEGGRSCVFSSADGRAELTVVDEHGAPGRGAVTAVLDTDEHGLPVRAEVQAAERRLRVDVLAVTPLALDDERLVRRPRALCRYRLDDGSIGVGWLEVHGDRWGHLGAGDG